jgi:predicted regulator of Ras-like GTPase activity (Roadblock/LC7/MglB family)
MNNNVYAFALKSTLDEIQSACPDVSNAFIFKDGKILAKGETTDENTADLTINAFDSITERADSLGSLETVTIQGANGRVSITCMNDFYLTTVLSKKADEKYVNTLTRVLIPTVIKLVEKIQPTPAGDETLTVKPEPAEEEVAEEDAESAEDNENEPAEEEETATTEPTEEQETAEEEETPEVDDEPLLPEPPVIQLIIENLGGLLVPSDTVRIDKAVIAQWNDLYGDKKIEEVDLETLSGKTTRCKFKPIKDSKHKEKGIIQMPEKIQLTLEVAKGELVMVKPAVE